ncbi:MAG: 50S ribosomal protein L17 [Candidatus Moranbacteria bacterium]|nr:50S ribosomal protein L17 [Candidatus Moranbacteria bacterium]
MKHRVKGRKLSRIRKQRRSLLKSLLASLIMREKIATTEAKAKELKPLVERIIHKAKQAKVDDKKKVKVIRDLQNMIPSPAVKKLSSDFLNRFSERSSGYVRVVKLGRRRGDSANMAVIEFV